MIYHKSRNIIIYLIACIALTAISCGTLANLPTVQPTAPVPHVTAPIPTFSANVESVDTKIHTYITTAPLHVRSCASVECAVLAYLPTEASVTVKVTGIPGPGCAGAEWWSIEAGGVAGFVCSLYVKEAK
jgi:hypothetical protein